ncbi:hypothetical protein HYV44_03025 [Candidatus Microgenomates bacterium]|nr:hypothetical protein [Candidatus Microgenomates bacterium]
MSRFQKLAILIRLVWKKFTKVEKIVAIILVAAIFFSAISLGQDFYYLGARIIPQDGGVLIEGIVGQPKVINPVLAKTEADKIATSLIFAPLLSRNEKNEPIPVLAEKWNLSPDKLDYTINLRKNLLWHDGAPFGADDIVYTIAVVQNPDYQDTATKAAWEGVRVDKIDDSTVNFHLSSPYASFLNALAINIIPRHIWVDVPVKDFAKSPYSLNPVGLGAYKLGKITQDKEGKINLIKLSAHDGFVLGRPHLKTIDLKFYSDKESLLKGFVDREFTSFGTYSFDGKQAARNTRGYTKHDVFLPQYVGAFFNLKRVTPLTDASVRQALAYATDKNRLNKEVNFGAGVSISSPILPGYLGYDDTVKNYNYDKKNAQAILSQAGWTDQDNDGIREKEGQKLSFILAMPDEPQFDRLITELSRQWQEMGVSLNIQKAPSNSFEEKFLVGRDYDIVLIGENIGADPDPYSYWHSSQAFYPGLNLSLWENGEADQLLQEARQINDANVKIRDYKKFQDIFAAELPAILFYQPTYVYKAYKGMKGIDLSGISMPSERFYNIFNWYVKYERARK